MEKLFVRILPTEDLLHTYSEFYWFNLIANLTTLFKTSLQRKLRSTYENSNNCPSSDNLFWRKMSKKDILKLWRELETLAKEKFYKIADDYIKTHYTYILQRLQVIVKNVPTKFWFSSIFLSEVSNIFNLFYFSFPFCFYELEQHKFQPDHRNCLGAKLIKCTCTLDCSLAHAIVSFSLRNVKLSLLIGVLFLFRLPWDFVRGWILLCESHGLVWWRVALCGCQWRDELYQRRQRRIVWLLFRSNWCWRSNR